MLSRQTLQLTLGIALLLGSSSAGAAPPNGTYSVEVTGEQEIFLPDALFMQDVAGGGLVGHMLAATDVDAVGRVTGLGTIDVGGLATGHGSLVATGQVGGRARATLAKLQFQTHVPLDILGVAGDADLTWKLRCRKVEDFPNQWACPGKIRVCIGGQGVRTRCVGGPFGAFFFGVGGPWTAAFDLSTDSDGIVTGSALVTLATGQEIELTALGKYSPKSDSSKISFHAAPPFEPARLALKRFTVGAKPTGTMTFKLGGQTGSVDLSTLP